MLWINSTDYTNHYDSEKLFDYFLFSYMDMACGQSACFVALGNSLNHSVPQFHLYMSIVTLGYRMTVKI